MEEQALIKQINHPTVQELIESFLSGRTQRTLEAYQQDLNDFMNFTNSESIQEAAAQLLDNHGQANYTAMQYKAWLKETKKLGASTINRRLAALRSLVKLANTLGIISYKLEVSNEKVEAYRDTRGPGNKAVKKIKATAGSHRNEKKAARDKAIIHLLYDIALRRGEVVELDIEHVDLERGLVSVLGKGRTQREILSLPEPTIEAIQNWFEVRGTEPGPLFTNFDHAGKGKRLTGTSVSRIVAKLGEDVGVKTRPHGLRHTAITEAVKKAQDSNNDIGLEEVIDFSRHKDIRTLMIYRDRERNVQGTLAKLIATTIVVA